MGYGIITPYAPPYLPPSFSPLIRVTRWVWGECQPVRAHESDASALTGPELLLTFDFSLDLSPSLLPPSLFVIITLNDYVSG